MDSLFPEPDMVFWPPGESEIPRVLSWKGGLSKRDLFAAMAMQSIIGVADQRILDAASVTWPSAIANEAVRYADLLLAELAKEPSQPPTEAGP